MPARGKAAAHTRLESGHSPRSSFHGTSAQDSSGRRCIAAAGLCLAAEPRGKELIYILGKMRLIFGFIQALNLSSGTVAACLRGANL